MRTDVPGALENLNRVADRIAELIEWDKLAQQERRPDSTWFFPPRDHLCDDLRSLYGLFLSLGLSIHDVLNRPDLDARKNQHTCWERRLRKLEARVHEFQISEKLLRA